MEPVDPIQILLVEDQPADVRLTKEILAEGKVANEHEVLAEMKSDPDLMRTPVIVRLPEHPRGRR